MTDDLGAIFREELAELVENLERGLLDLQGQPSNAGLVNAVFRDLHTIKGSGAMFGFTDLAHFIHDFESAFDRIRSGRARMSPDILRLSLQARDMIPGLVDGAADPDGQRAAVLAALALALNGESPAPDAAPDAGGGLDPAVLADDLPCDAPRRGQLFFRLAAGAFDIGARPELILDELRALGAEDITPDLTALPAWADLDLDSCFIGWSMTLPAEVSQDQIDDVFLFHDAEIVFTPGVPDDVTPDSGAADAAPETAPETASEPTLADVAVDTPAPRAEAPAPKVAAPTAPSPSFAPQTAAPRPAGRGSLGPGAGGTVGCADGCGG